jgi:hypothetical protein
LQSPAAAENVLRWASGGGAATFDHHAYDDLQIAAQYRQTYEALVAFGSNQIGREMIICGRDAMIEEVWKIVLADVVYVPRQSSGRCAITSICPFTRSTPRPSARRG